MYLKVPEGSPGHSIGGTWYAVDENGGIEVPDEIGHELFSHGCNQAIKPVPIEDKTQTATDEEAANVTEETLVNEETANVSKATKGKTPKSEG